MTYADWSDVVRIYLAALAALLFVLFIRLALIVGSRHGWGRNVSPHPVGLVGTGFVLVGAAAGHYAAFGNPAPWAFWVIAVGYNAIAVGMGMSMAWSAPLRRRRRGRRGHDETQGHDRT